MSRGSWKVGVRAASLAAVVLGALAFASAPSDSFAQKKPAKEKEPPKPVIPAEAATTKDPIKLVPDGMKWGMSRGELEKLVDKFVDDEFRPRYKAAGRSGPKIKDLDAEASTQKAVFKRSWIDLVPGPSGLDSSPNANEMAKGNDEAIMTHHRGPGVKIWFFFLKGRLWKSLEEISFVKNGLYGEDMGEGLKRLVESVGGTMPRELPAEPDKGKYYVVLDWQDKDTHMRIWDRSGVLVIAREEKTTAANITSLRKNSNTGAAAGMDPSVSAILRGSDPAPPPDKKKPDDKKR